MIKVSKKNEKGELQEFEYNSLNEACRQNGATGSGRNRKACLNYLQKVGFDLNTLIETTKTKKQLGIVEKVIKLSKTVDTEKLKELEKERTQIMKTAKSTSDMEKILTINAEIINLQNPTVTDKAIKETFAKLLKEYRQNEKIENLKNQINELSSQIENETDTDKKNELSAQLEKVKNELDQIENPKETK